MNPIPVVRGLPQPVKSLYVLFLLGFPVAFLSIALLQEGVFRVFAGIGVVAGLMGLCLVTDVRGSAQAWARVTTEQRPWGIDYSQSVMSRPGFARLMGAGLVLVGAWLVLVGSGVVE